MIDKKKTETQIIRLSHILQKYLYQLIENNTNFFFNIHDYNHKANSFVGRPY
jgi:hypothetical protein